MKKVTAIALLAAGAWATNLSAKELPECKLRLAERGIQGGSYRPHAAASRMEFDPGALKTGQEVTYSRDQPILNTDYRIVRAGSVLVATDDFILKSSWMTNPDWKFRKGQTINVGRELLMPDGQAYPAISPQSDMVLFMTPDGEFCNQTLKVTGSTWTWLMGHLTRLPDTATLEWQATDNETASGRLRVIYTGASAGAMHFQEVWVKGSQIISSADRQFDQFADTIEIAGLRFHVADAKPDSIRISYSFGPKIDLGANGARMIPGLR